MANRGRSFLFLLVIAAGIGAYVWFVEMKRDPDAPEATTTQKVFTVEPAQISELRITNEAGEQSTLRRAGERWTLAEAPGAEVDETEASNILSSLSGLELNRVIDERPASLAEFGLDKPRVSAGFTDAAGKQHTLQIGSKTATGGDLYAKIDSAPRVFLIGSWLEETFDRSRFDLQDKSIAKFSRDAVTGVEIVSGTTRIGLARRNGAWQLTEPSTGPADDAAVDALLNRISSTKMQSRVQNPDLAALGLTKPVAAIGITAGPTRAHVEFGGKAGDTAVNARDTVRDIVFTVESSLVDELKKKPEDFRKKDQ